MHYTELLGSQVSQGHPTQVEGGRGYFIQTSPPPRMRGNYKKIGWEGKKKGKIETKSITKNVI